MDALLVLDNDNVKDCKIMVHLTKKGAKKKVLRMLNEDRQKEAFDILVKEAEFRAYLPGDDPPPKTPFLLTLREKLL